MKFSLHTHISGLCYDTSVKKKKKRPKKWYTESEVVHSVKCFNFKSTDRILEQGL